jgi:hypothetical protein
MKQSVQGTDNFHLEWPVKLMFSMSYFCFSIVNCRLRYSLILSISSFKIFSLIIVKKQTNNFKIVDNVNQIEYALLTIIDLLIKLLYSLLIMQV